MTRDTRNRTRLLTLTALTTAATCILAPLSIPIGPVPISLTTFVLYCSIGLLGWKQAAASCLAYILIGLAGLPVFSGFAGGPARLLGPTGGYIIGFIPMIVIAGLLMERTRSRLLKFFAMAVGTFVCYVFGTVWFCMVMDATPAAALTVCVLPFIPGDVAKMLAALCFDRFLAKQAVLPRP